MDKLYYKIVIMYYFKVYHSKFKPVVSNLCDELILIEERGYPTDYYLNIGLPIVEVLDEKNRLISRLSEVKQVDETIKQIRRKLRHV